MYKMYNAFLRTCKSNHFYSSCIAVHFVGEYGILQRRYDVNGRSHVQGSKNWILPKDINANRFF